MSQSIFVKRFKKFVASTLISSLLLNPIAYATSSYIELDFRESDTADRLHTMMPLSNVRDVSHLELDTHEQRVSVYKQNKTVESDLDTDTLSVVPHTSVLSLPQENVRNLPWHLSHEHANCIEKISC